MMRRSNRRVLVGIGRTESLGILWYFGADEVKWYLSKIPNGVLTDLLKIALFLYHVI